MTPILDTLRLRSTARVHWKKQLVRDVCRLELKRIRRRSSTIPLVFSLELAEPRWTTVYWWLDTVKRVARSSGKSRTPGETRGERKDTSRCAGIATRTEKKENAESCRDQCNLNFNELESIVYM